MEQQTLKITNVLSDPTRFSIYQYISKQHADVTVQEIADNFDIHANVARLHLTKLEDVKMLVSETKKTGKGGRPSRFYRLSEEVVTLQFPFRDYQLLAEMLLETVMGFGEEGLEALNKMGYKYGYETAKSYTNRFEQDMSSASIKEKLDIVARISANLGLNPELNYTEGESKVSFQIYNCTFKELINTHSQSLCKMHHAMILGIFDYFFGKVKLIENQMMSSGCNLCDYTTVLLSES